MIKIALSEVQIWTQNFDFRGHISTFRAENICESVAFDAKNELLTYSKPTCKKSRKQVFDPKNCQNDPL